MRRTILATLGLLSSLLNLPPAAAQAPARVQFYDHFQQKLPVRNYAGTQLRR